MPVRTLARAILLPTLLIGVFAGSAKADAVYTYTGSTFVFTQGVYTQADRITGNFVLPSSFVPTIFGAGLNNSFGPVSYSFTDGHQTLTQYNSTATFEASASSNGTLGFTQMVNGSYFGSWLVDIQTPTSGILIHVDGDWYMQSWMGGAGPSGWHPCGSTYCFNDPTIPTAWNDSGIIGGGLGTWTVRTPEGGTTALFLLAGLIILGALIRLK